MISKKIVALSFALGATILLFGMEIKNTQPSIAEGKKAAEKALNEGDLATAENLIKQLENLQQRNVAAPLRERLERAKQGRGVTRGTGLQQELEENLRAALDQLTQCQQELNALRNQLRESERIRAELADRVKTQEDAIKNLKTLLQKRDLELQKCNTEINRLSDDLRKAQEKEKEIRSQLSKDAREKVACQEELAKLKKELEDTKNQLALAKTSPAPDTGDCADRIKVLTQQLEAARASEAKAVSSASDARKESQNTLRRVEAAEEMRDQIKRSLEAEIKKLQQENAKIKDCEAKIATIKAAINVAIEIIKADPAKGVETLKNAQQNL